MIVAAGVHVGLSKVFPDHQSLISESVLAADVLEGRVPGYEHLSYAARHPETNSVDKEAEYATKVVEA